MIDKNTDDVAKIILYSIIIAGRKCTDWDKWWIHDKR